MSNTPHELAEEFPEHSSTIDALKETQPHFARLVDDYHQINLEVYRAQENIAPTDDQHENEMRKKRLVLKDEIWRILSNNTV